MRVAHGDTDLRGRALVLGAGTEAHFDGLAVTQDGDATQHQGFQRGEHRKPPAIVVRRDTFWSRTVAEPQVGVRVPGGFGLPHSFRRTKSHNTIPFYTIYQVFVCTGQIFAENQGPRQNETSLGTKETHDGEKCSREKWKKDKNAARRPMRLGRSRAAIDPPFTPLRQCAVYSVATASGPAVYPRCNRSGGSAWSALLSQPCRCWLLLLALKGPRKLTTPAAARYPC